MVVSLVVSHCGSWMRKIGDPISEHSGLDVPFVLLARSGRIPPKPCEAAQRGQGSRSAG